MKIRILSKKEVLEETGSFDVPNMVYDRPTNGLTPPPRLKMAIYERDNRKCSICKKDLLMSRSRRESPIFHHLKRISYCGPGDHSPNNLIAICYTCHTAIHSGKIVLIKENDGT